MRDIVRLRRLTGFASVGVAFILIVAKGGAFLATGSIALLSSLIDSCLDFIASLITAFGIAKASQPPDREHRFGHGKAESLAALAQAAFIVGSSVLLGLEALDRFVKPKPIENAVAGYLVMGLAILMTSSLLALQNYTVKRTNSLAIKADRLHYAGDALVNLAVIIALIGQDLLGWPWIDPLFALIIAASMIYGGWQIGRHSLAVLMDSELPETERKKIMALALETPGVKGAHDLRTRSDSLRSIIEIHIEMLATLSLREAHDISDAVERQIRKDFPKADILIHQDPTGLKEFRLDKIIEKNDPNPT